MRTIIFILLTLVSTFVSSQDLIDTVNFDSINKGLINDELIKRIIETRILNGCAESEKDISAMYTAKYHTTYFEKYGDESTIQDKELELDLYGDGGVIKSIFDTPENRLFTLGLIKSNNKFLYYSVKEISKFYKLKKNTKLKYNDLVDILLSDLTNDKEVIHDYSNIKKYLGVSNSIFNLNDEEIILTTTLVIGRREKNNINEE